MNYLSMLMYGMDTLYTYVYALVISVYDFMYVTLL
jgi:hypothetical protein